MIVHPQPRRMRGGTHGTRTFVLLPAMGAEGATTTTTTTRRLVGISPVASPAAASARVAPGSGRPRRCTSTGCGPGSSPSPDRTYSAASRRPLPRPSAHLGAGRYALTMIILGTRGGAMVRTSSSPTAKLLR